MPALKERNNWLNSYSFFMKNRSTSNADYTVAFLLTKYIRPFENVFNNWIWVNFRKYCYTSVSHKTINLLYPILVIKKLKNHCWAVSIFEDEEEENSLDFDQGPIKGLTGRHWARKISSDYFLLSAANEPAQVFTQLLFKRSFETAETIW